MQLAEMARPAEAGLLAAALAATLRASMGRSVERSEQRSGVYRPPRRTAASRRDGQGVHAA